jgi:hypothetical protein
LACLLRLQQGRRNHHCGDCCLVSEL